MASELREAFVRSTTEASQIQYDVAGALRRIGWRHVFEHRTAEGISLDMAQPDSKVAVEFDGPRHFIVDVSSRTISPNGPSLLKRRLLRMLGWRVWHLPYFEWDTLESTTAKEKYLSRGLANIEDADTCTFLPQATFSLDEVAENSPMRDREPGAYSEPHESGVDRFDHERSRSRNRTRSRKMSPSRRLQSHLSGHSRIRTQEALDFEQQDGSFGGFGGRHSRCSRDAPRGRSREHWRRIRSPSRSRSSEGYRRSGALRGRSGKRRRRSQSTSPSRTRGMQPHHHH